VSTSASKAAPPPQIHISQLAWAAGVVDMKGRTRTLTAPTRTSPMFTLMVETKHLSVARRLARLSGTRIMMSKSRKLPESMRRGCVEHCPEAHTHTHPVIPAIARWHVSGVGAIIVVDNLLPHLTDKRAEFAEFMHEALQWVRPAGKGRGRAAIDKSIARLAALGWEVMPELTRAAS
jgi:hypothetical protein